MKVALVGEAPNDTLSIQNLLVKRYSSNISFFSLLNRINGSQLDNQKTKRFLRIEYETKKPDIVIFIRDLDDILPSVEKIANRKLYFSSSNSVVDKKGIFLLNVFEIEALILADIETFNKIYNCNIKSIPEPMSIIEPKELLRSYSKDYNESHNPDVFKKLNFENTLNCSYFNLFILKLDQEINKIIS
ncbi:MAG: hypothetical protein K0R65_1211 [Crocinitomicaceae bacterium]|jgi:hypothetical protein|nr:hypothetical protein [Crocinitomicaceae bacterium]